MCTQALDIMEYTPVWKGRYLAMAGWHFTREACDFAVKYMRKKNDKGELISIKPMSKADVDELLKKYGITLNNNIGYDYVYVANMAKADFEGSSIVDEKHMAMYIRDVIDDPDAGIGQVMRQWYAACVGKGVYVDWEEMIGEKTVDTY